MVEGEQISIVWITDLRMILIESMCLCGRGVLEGAVNSNSFKIFEVKGSGSYLMEEKLSEFCRIFEK